MEKHLENGRPLGLPLTAWQMSAVFVLVTLITASHLDEIAPTISRILRVLAYGSTLLIIAWLAWPPLRSPRTAMHTFFQAYRRTILWPLVLYFLGLIIGALRGPQPLYSLWQTFSDAVVFAFALLAFGWLVSDLNRAVRRLLVVVALLTSLILVESLVVYVGNLAGWWLLNPYYHPGDFGFRMLMNGPFTHSNHLAYILMVGAFAAGILALVLQPKVQWSWLALTAWLALGVAVTFGRGAMLGTATGLLGILSMRHRKLAIALGAVARAGVLALVAGAAGWITLPDFLPKIGFAARGELWSAAITNLRVYGPLGVGSGQADSIPGMGIHNFILEQYGEGGVLTTLGVLGWLVLP
ncbi:MAG: hypothetical protein MUO38_10390, partial [Anaerolineales bacterium]|nr:hypothetical protein [Anaerolineales bacterium]